MTDPKRFRCSGCGHDAYEGCGCPPNDIGPSFHTSSSGVVWATGVANTTGTIEIGSSIDPVELKKAWKDANVKIPELYPENLDTLKAVMKRLPLLGNLEGVFDIEIRVRVDDLETWAVIGYGVNADPALLRFEAL